MFEKPIIYGMVQAEILKTFPVDSEIGQKVVEHKLDANMVTSDVPNSHLLLKVIATATHNTITEGAHTGVLAVSGEYWKTGLNLEAS